MGTDVMFRFSRPARQALSAAQRTAVIEQAASIEGRHLLIGLADGAVDESTAAHVLSGMGITIESLNPPKIQPHIPGSSVHPELSDGIKRTLERAAASAQQRRDKTLVSAHLLMGLLDDTDARQALASTGVTAEHVRSALDSLDDWNES